MASPVTIAYGEGRWPEIMDALLCILAQARAPVSIDTIELGESQYKMGNQEGISPLAWENLRRSRVLLRSPVAVPAIAEAQHPDIAILGKMGVQASFVHLSFCFPSLPPLALVYKAGEGEGAEFHAAFRYAQRHGLEKIAVLVQENDTKWLESCEVIAASYSAITFEKVTQCRPSAGHGIIVIAREQYPQSVQEVIQESGGRVIESHCHSGENFCLFETGEEASSASNERDALVRLLHAFIHLLFWLGHNEAGAQLGNALAAAIEAPAFATTTLPEAMEYIIMRLGQRPLLLASFIRLP